MALPIDIEDLRGDLDDDTLLSNITRDEQSSSGFMESQVHDSWTSALKLWQGTHLTTPPAGRSQLFLRKPRNIAERIKAGLLDAFFGAGDPVSINPSRENVPDDILGAKVRQAYINYRLSGKSIPWFQLMYSAIDDLTVHNVCVMRPDWIHEVDRIEYTEEIPVVNPQTGEPMVGEDGEPMIEEKTGVVEQTVRDEPDIKLVAPEFMRIDSRVDWINPYAGQYIIEKDRLTYQTLKNMAEVDPKINLEGVDQAAQAQYTDIVNDQRYRGITPEILNDIDRMEIDVWRYWYKVGAKWWLAWTGKDRTVIRKPERNPFAHGKPNYIFGFHIPESHLFYADSIINVHKDYFVALNGIRNQRFDNVALVLNKHAIVSRSQNVDLASLVNRRPGGVTQADGDVRTAVAWNEVPDVAASGYNEEVLLDRELQEGSGVTNQGQGLEPARQELATQSVIRQQQSDKKEAVNIRIVAHTLVIPTIEMIIQLADQFETDLQVLSIVGATLGLGEKDDNIPDLLEIKGLYSVKVSAGIGSLTQDVKMQQLDVAMQRLQGAFGPFATIPLWKEYLPLLGIKNVNEVLAAINQASQLEQLLALLGQGQEGGQKENTKGGASQPPVQGVKRQAGAGGGR